jgi:hypothetical protein
MCNGSNENWCKNCEIGVKLSCSDKGHMTDLNPQILRK